MLAGADCDRLLCLQRVRHFKEAAYRNPSGAIHTGKNREPGAEKTRYLTIEIKFFGIAKQNSSIPYSKCGVDAVIAAGRS